jgi:hypothetical protein
MHIRQARFGLLPKRHGGGSVEHFVLLMQIISWYEATLLGNYVRNVRCRRTTAEATEIRAVPEYLARPLMLAWQ